MSIKQNHSIAAGRAVGRRTLLSGALALGGVSLLGFQGQASAANRPRPRIVMHRSPTCGCCLKWADKARAAGFAVGVVESRDMAAVKRQLGVPDALASCHTSTIGGYVIEGHVPLQHVKALLATKPKVRGIAVPGMPLGAPGMEVPGYAGDAFEVFAFDAAGNFKAFKA